MTDFTAYSATTHPVVRLEDDYNNILDHALEKGVSYIIRKNGSVYEAIEGATGKIGFGGVNDVGGIDGADAVTVMQAAFTVGGTILFKDGTYTLNTGDTSKLHQISFTTPVILK